MAGKAPFDIAAFAGLVGHEVAIRLKGGESSAFSSVVFATDALRQLIVFRSSPVHTFAKGEYRVVAVAEIASVEDKGVSREPLPSLRAVTEAEASRKLSEARGAGLKRQLSRGIGVTAEAQAIFDKLNKTMECSWNADLIVVLRNVVVRPPYTPADVGLVSGHDVRSPANVEAVKRVRTVLANMRQQLGLDPAVGGASSAVSPPPASTEGAAASGVVSPPGVAAASKGAAKK